jgi:ribosomal-protein-alanine N-acetyltransferase
MTSLFEKPSPPLLETSRLRLRPVTKTDTPAFHGIYSCPETMRYWSGEAITSMAQAEEMVRTEMEYAESADCINWGIALPESDRLIGKITLFRFSAQNHRAETGYVLDRRHWGQGFMSEAMKCVLDFARSELALHRIEADCDPDNQASLALLEKFGFKREGLFRDRWFVAGEWRDSVMLGLLF